MAKNLNLSSDPRLIAELELRKREYQSELDKCAGDIVYWCNSYVKGYDPRKLELGLSPNVPFVLYEYQVEYLTWLQDRLDAQEHGLLEKSRDMGASWLNIIFDCHKWLFVPGYKAGIGSYKEDKVDRKGDMDSLFEKVRHLLDNLPSWMLPAGFKIQGEYDNFMRIYNPQTGATITGEAGRQIGRGGRNTRYTLDEHAFLEYAQDVEKAVSQNTNCVIYTSTPNGMGNLFAEKRFSGKIKVFTMHWRMHPEKDDKWYARQVANLDAVTVAQEIDIDYAASVEGIIIPSQWVRAAIDLHTKVPGMDAGPSVAGLDVGESRDPTAYIARKGAVVTSIHKWEKTNTTQTAYKAKEYAVLDQVEQLRFDAIGIGAGVRGTLQTHKDDLEQAKDDSTHMMSHDLSHIAKHTASVGVFDQSGPGTRRTPPSNFLQYPGRSLYASDSSNFTQKNAKNPQIGLVGSFDTSSTHRGELSGIEGPFELVGIHWGSTGVRGEPFRDNPEKPLTDRFLNQRAADWYNLRLRFEAAYEHVSGIREHDPLEMISIPNDHELISELSLPLKQYTSVGKIKLESKDSMRRRGVRSPNKADALAYCFSTYEAPFLIGVF